MRPLGVAVMLAGATAVAAAVWLSVGAQVAALVEGAGWWAVPTVLAVPVFMGIAAWRGWDSPY